MLVLLAPVMAFAQSGPSIGETPLNQQVAHSPLTWSWVAILAVAVVAFVVYSALLSRHRRPPMTRG